MILAAGRGERLRPLTDSVPKAMVQAGGKPLIARHIERLAAARCREGIGDGGRYGLRIGYSREREPLETAGGIAQARSLLGEAPFLLVNADVYCEIDFGRLLALDLGERLAHLVLVPNPPHRADGDFSLAQGVVGNEGGARYTYAGIAVMSPALVSPVKPGDKAPLAPLLRAAAARERIGGELHRGIWQDVGTRERLMELEAHLDRT
jgi:N-acetyl-alpha-D-muramate 1-phosphate uridylyltransferase